MSRRSSRRRRTIQDDDEEEDVKPSLMELEADEAHDQDEDQEEEDMPRRKSRHSRASFQADEEVMEEEESESKMELEDDNNSTRPIKLSQMPEMSQEILPVKPSERNNLLSMSQVQRDKTIMDVTRLILFKSLSGESIDRSKVLREAGVSEQRVSSAVFDEANLRLRNMFGFQLKCIPPWMGKVKGVSASKYKDRYFLVSDVELEVHEKHCRALHSIHTGPTIQHGLLMLILAFCYCKGEPRADGSRWILDKDLFHLLHMVDENIPAEPPSVTNMSSKARRMSSSQLSQHSMQADASAQGGGGVSLTPHVDVELEVLVHREYIVREKATPQHMERNARAEESSLFYTMGPRAAIEIGRKQVIYFCAEILDQEVDQAMLQEIENGEDDEEEEP